MKILFSSFSSNYKEYEALFLSLLEKTTSMLDYNFSPIVSVDLVKEEVIHTLNKQYRGIDRPTDVLSFAYLENEEDKAAIFASSEEVELGDIIICLPIARKQAIAYKHSEKRELCFLFVHGLLHLFGYDHQNSNDEREMFSLQDKILKESGIDR
ncbi:MAG: rRNA maturation RNase YbeY [Coprobacillus sp.]|nr:rRNA maturation RNase YbeY [Coprobacillus sp.]